MSSLIPSYIFDTNGQFSLRKVRLTFAPWGEGCPVEVSTLVHPSPYLCVPDNRDNLMLIFTVNPGRIIHDRSSNLQINREINTQIKTEMSRQITIETFDITRGGGGSLNLVM